MIEINFEGRKEMLQNIVRYHRFTPMFYRSNLWQHSQRLAWMIEEVAPMIQQVYPQFNTKVAQLIAQVHDDHEIVLGDIMLGEKLKYNDEQRAELDAKERAAIDSVVEMFPEKIGSYTYKDLLMRYQNLDVNDVEAVVVKYFDKFDAFGEALHEVYAGNDAFTHGYLPTTQPPVESYINILQNFATHFPLFEKIRLAKGHRFFDAPENFNVAEFTRNRTPHTTQSLNTYSEYIPYQLWKQNILKYGGEEEKRELVTKVE